MELNFHGDDSRLMTALYRFVLPQGAVIHHAVNATSTISTAAIRRIG